MLIYMATVIAGLAATAFGNLVHRPPARPLEEATFNWASMSMAAAFAVPFATATAFLAFLTAAQLYS